MINALGRKVEHLRLDGLEVFNSMIPGIFNRRAEECARKLGLPGVAGSDAHMPEAIGTSITAFPAYVKDYRDAIACIREGNVRLRKRGTGLLAVGGMYLRRLTN